MQYLFKNSMMMSILILIVILFKTKHPLLFMFIILMISVISAINFYIFSMDSFLSIIFILMISGGILILMLYMSSLYSNETFPTLMNFWIILFMTFSLFAFPLENFSYQNKNNSINMILSVYSSTLYLFLCSYLFILLISTMKISMKKKGPLLK